ncbi:methionyl-tRNA formyltransferase [Candidatus Peregrinibacteria bacterium]|nr:methionyl-tRNA formyltransferase [Candidatus Peregrinibacteria bacterium]
MHEKIKIVYMGTPEFAVAPLKSLIENDNFEVQAVVTQPDKKIGRKQKITAPPVKKSALEYDKPVLQPDIIKNNTDFINLLKNLKPDFLVVIAFGQILPGEVLKIPTISSINVHGSLLPMYRGASPINACLLNGDAETGVSYMKMKEKMDAGPIYQLQRIPIDPIDDAKTLAEKLSTVAALQLPSVLESVSEGILDPLPQDENKASYCHKINKHDGLIDPQNETAEKILNKWRAYTPWPGIYMMHNDKKIILHDIISTDKIFNQSGFFIENNKLFLGTKDGTLEILMLQLEGKKALKTQEFLAGNASLFKT